MGLKLFNILEILKILSVHLLVCITRFKFRCARMRMLVHVGFLKDTSCFRLPQDIYNGISEILAPEN